MYNMIKFNDAECNRVLNQVRQTWRGERFLFNNEEMWIDFDLYWNGNLSLQLMSNDGPYARISVNIIQITPGDFAVDVNNFPEAIDFLEDNKIAYNTGMKVHSGFCNYPIYSMYYEQWEKMEV